jgi:hypothetical protein
MIFLPEILNNHGLFQHFNGLKKEGQSFGDLKEAILNHGTDAILRMERIRSLNERVIGEFSLFANQMDLKDDKLVFSSTSMGALLSEVSPLLSTVRILQNKAIGLVGVWESVSMPQSMNDFVKKSRNYKISGNAKELINQYWELSGRYVKYYRDIDQHDFVGTELTSRYFIKIRPEIISHIEIPDFQETTKRSSFTYEKQLNALEFLDDACDQVHKLIEDIAKVYGAASVPIQGSTRLAQLGDLTPFRQRTLSVMFEQSVSMKGGIKDLNLSAIKMNQLEDGRIEIQKILLTKEKLDKARELYGVPALENEPEQ